MIFSRSIPLERPACLVVVVWLKLIFLMSDLSGEWSRLVGKCNEESLPKPNRPAPSQVARFDFSGQLHTPSFIARPVETNSVLLLGGHSTARYTSAFLQSIRTKQHSSKIQIAAGSRKKISGHSLFADSCQKALVVPESYEGWTPNRPKGRPGNHCLNQCPRVGSSIPSFTQRFRNATSLTPMSLAACMRGF